MDIGSLIPIERVVDVLDPRNGEPTGLKLTIAHDSDPRVVDAMRKLYDEAREKDDVDHSRGLRATMAHIVGWEWTGEANFKGSKPKFTAEKLAEVCAVPAVGSAVYRAVTDEAGFYKG